MVNTGKQLGYILCVVLAAASMPLVCLYVVLKTHRERMRKGSLPRHIERRLKSMIIIVLGLSFFLISIGVLMRYGGLK